MADAYLIVNADARRSQDWLYDTLGSLWAAGVRVRWTAVHRDLAALQAAAAEAVRVAARPVIVAGGDGTMSLLVDYFAHRDVVLGVIPFGTGNDFARGLGIPSDPRAAAAIIGGGHVVRAPLLRVGDDYGVNTVNVGCSVHLRRLVEGPWKRRVGRLLYLYALARGLLAGDSFEGEVTADGWRVAGRMCQIGVVLGPVFGAGAAPAPGAGAGGGFAAYAVLARGRLGLARAALALRRGVDLEASGVLWTKATRAHITAAAPEPVALDGQVVGQTPVTVEYCPAALAVLAPEVRHERKAA